MIKKREEREKRWGSNRGGEKGRERWEDGEDEKCRMWNRERNKVEGKERKKEKVNDIG